MSGLKWPPAVVNAGPSHLAFWCTCAACSPGGRPLTFSWITTPPLLASEIFAVPTGCPLASMRATVTGLLAANTVAAVNRPARAKKATGLVIFISTTCIVARFAASSHADGVLTVRCYGLFGILLLVIAQVAIAKP